MKDKIKRVAQFLFDNAEFVGEQITKSKKHRSVDIGFSSYPDGTGRVAMATYSEKSGINTLVGDHINIEEFTQLFEMINFKDKLTPMPEPEEIREKL